MGVLNRVPRGTVGNLEGVTDYFVGLDLGQENDHSAIAGLERVWKRSYSRNMVTWEFDPDDEVQLRLRYLERIPLGTAYPKVVERVATICRSLARRGRCGLAADATGVGAGIVDMLKAADLGATTALLPVVITSGDHAHYQHGRHRVPKINLVAGLQTVLGREELTVAADLREFGRLVEEMRGFGAKLTEGRAQSFGGKKDDLVIALALAVWGAGITDFEKRDVVIPGLPGRNGPLLY